MQLKFKNGLIKINPYNHSETAEIAIKSSSFKAKLSTWGDEIYFKTPFKGVKLDDKATDLINLGEIAYWVEGNSIAIGFGPTPASKANEIRLVSPTNIWASFDPNPKNLDIFRVLNDGDIVEFLN
jgi:hypothetical protein